MEYRGIRYTIRAGIERGQWFVVIHTEGAEVSANKIFGAREDAEVHAHRMINKWFDAKSGQEPTDRAVDQVDLPLPLYHRGMMGMSLTKGDRLAAALFPCYCLARGFANG